MTDKSANNVLFKVIYQRFLVVFLMVCLAIMFGVVNAQDLNTRMSQAQQSWQTGEYQKCHQILENIIVVYSNRPIPKGGKFGVIYYRKGLCELRLADINKRANKKDAAKKWFEKAAKSFETCYKKYSHEKSLQRWAEASMEIGKYNDAIFYYERVCRNSTNLTISAPAVKRVMELLWDRDLDAGATIESGEKAITLKKSDRQTAYEDIGIY